MFDKLLHDISKYIVLNDDEKHVFIQSFIRKKLKKRQYFLQEGSVAFHTSYVASGCLKSYTIDKNGTEHIHQFSTEGWWATDMFSFLTGEPAQFNIEAIEDSELLIMDKAGRENLFERVPKFERFMRILIEKNVVAGQSRLNAMLGESAENRYLSFVKKYPHLIQRVPQHMIASYLGMTPETLSRVRKQLATS